MGHIFDSPQRIGVFSKDTIPSPATHQFQDSDGAAISIDGFTVGVDIEAVDEVVAGLGAGTASVSNGSSGIMKYIWVAADFVTSARYRIQFWAQNGAGTVRHTSDIFEYDVNDNTDNPI